MIREISFTGTPVTDMARARSCYAGMLDLKPTSVHGSEQAQWEGYEFAPHALTSGSSLMFKPSPEGCSVALKVEDHDAAIAQLKQHSVNFRIESMATPVSSVKMIHDPDGNSICIHKRKGNW